MTWQTVGDVAVLALYVVPAVAAPLDYQRTARWRDSPLGRHLMAYMVVVAWFGLLSTYRVLWRWTAGGDAPGFDVLRAVGFIALGIVLWWRWWVVHQWRRRGDLAGRTLPGATLRDDAVPDQDGPARH